MDPYPSFYLLVLAAPYGLLLALGFWFRAWLEKKNTKARRMIGAAVPYLPLLIPVVTLAVCAKDDYFTQGVAYLGIPLWVISFIFHVGESNRRETEALDDLHERTDKLLHESLKRRD